ncbi:MAG: LD-carboxypeptidase [Pseudomonadota bacterium]
MTPLRPGDSIGLVAPSFAADPSVWTECRALFQARGFDVIFFGYDAIPEGRMAAPDAIRAAHLQAAFADPRTAAVLCLRGGCGASRLLDRLDFDVIAASRKPFIGYSDATALHMALRSRAGLASFHGPMAGDLVGYGDSESLDALLDTLTSAQSGMALTAQPDHARPGHAAGPLVGGNLSVLTSLIGTPEFDMPEGAILLLEDVGEPDYRLDRALVQLIRSGVLARCGGVLFGDTIVAPGPIDTSLPEIAAPYLTALEGPVAFGLPVGHLRRNITLPLGTHVALDVSPGVVRIDWPDLWSGTAPNRRFAAE